MVKDEFHGSNLGEMQSEAANKILEMLDNDKQAISENADEFKKILPQYILAQTCYTIMQWIFMCQLSAVFYKLCLDSDLVL